SIPIRIGFGGALHSIFYHYKGKIYSYEREGKLRPIPMDLYYFRLLESLGIEPKDRTLELPLDQDRKDFSRQYLESLGIQSSKPLVALNPGAAFGSSKLWPPDYFSRLGDMIVQELDAQILILCGPGEEELARKIHQNMKAKDACFSTHHQIIPLRYLGAVLRHCQLMISTDSGPRHFATAFQVPLIVLAGPIHPGYTQLAQESLVFVKEDTPCAPCHKKVCPIDHPCMTRLLPEKVMVSVRSLWEKYVAGTFQGLFE
ncbi:MAG: glycosyltransferase family 9 protein, partial [Planctomycetota bacterium]